MTRRPVVVVSGRGTGMGRAIAGSFAADGDPVLILGRREDVLEKTAADLGGGQGAVTWHGADLSDPGQVAAATEHLAEVGVVVNAAGGVDRSDAETLPEVADSWLRDYRSNVLTAALLTTALLPKLCRPGGRIVTISSIAALRGGDSYSATTASP